MITGISKTKIKKGIKEIESKKIEVLNDKDRIRTKGGGRKAISAKKPDLLVDLDNLIF